MSASIVRNPNTEPAWLDDDTLRAVRPQVRHLLESSAGFRELDPEKQQDIARTMVRVASYMANPQGLAKQELTPGKGVLASAVERAVALSHEKYCSASIMLAKTAEITTSFDLIDVV